MRALIPWSVVTWLALGAAPALAAPGDLDSGYGTGGLVATPVPHYGHETIVAVALEPGSGKILLAGTEQYLGSPRMFVKRLNTTGTDDTTYAGDSKVESVAAAFPGATQTSFTAAAMVVDTATGTATVAGTSTDAGNSESHVALMRVTSTGARDPAFGSGGEVVVDLPGIADEHARGVTYDASGNIYVVGFGFTGLGDQEAFVARYTSTGTLDATFAGDGVYLYDAVGDDVLSAVIATGTGILAAGESNHEFLFVKLATDGVPVPAFDVDGVLTVDFGSSDDEGATAAALETAGGTKLVAVGTAHSNFGGGALRDQMAAVRIDPATGALDTTFDGDGKVLNDFGSDGAIAATASALAVEPDQELLLAGSTTASTGARRVALMRLTTGGVPATTHDHSLAGDDGLESFAVTFSDGAAASSVALNASGVSTIAGSTANGGAPNHGIIARTLENGSSDGSFVTVGQAIESFASQFAILPLAPVTTSSGDVVAGLTATLDGAQQFAFVRTHANGTPDLGVSPTGLAVLDAPTPSERLEDVTADGDRVMLFGGSVNGFAVIERATAAGALDAGFGAGGVVQINTGFDPDVRGLAGPDHTVYVAYSGVGGVRVRHYFANGTQDLAFGTGGTATLTTPGGLDFASPFLVDLRTDGTLRVLTRESGPGTSAIAAYALSSAGTSIGTYGGGGRSVLSAGAVVNPSLTGGGFDAAGRLVVVGTHVPDQFAAALSADGQPDGGFGTAGLVAPLSPFVAQATVLPDGRLVLLGSAVRRVLTDGSIDTSFGDAGHTASPVLPGLPVFAAAPNGGLLLSSVIGSTIDSAQLYGARLRGDVSDAGVTVSTADPVISGQTATLTVVLSSAGPQAARGVTTHPTLPTGLSVESATASQGSCGASGQCSLGTIAPNSTATVALVLRTSATGTFNVPISVTQLVADASSANDTTVGHVTVIDPPTGVPSTPIPITTPPPTHVVDKTAPRLRLEADRKKLYSTHRTGRLVVKMTLNEPATVALTVRVGKLVLGRVTVKVTRPGTRTVTIKLSKSGRALVKHHGRRVITVSGTATDAARNRGTASAKATLKA